MITTKTEIITAKGMVEQVKKDLASEGKAFNHDIKIGIMIETPAAAFDVHILAKEVDFFSIGTNDLIQYLFAADRTNARVAGLNSPFQPALLRVIHHVVNTAHQNGIEADICGMAAEVEKLIPLWVAMGIDNLSVSIPKITAVRKMICGIRKSECEKLLNKVLLLETPDDVEHELGKFYEQEFIDDN
jgi:phosphotransferase system enzyme I (PtsI)